MRWLRRKTKLKIRHVAVPSPRFQPDKIDRTKREDYTEVAKAALAEARKR